jgi:drug/metabolite transporter (DMT)-like permease
MQDLETLKSLRWIGGGIVFLGVCCFVPSAILAEFPGLGEKEKNNYNEMSLSFLGAAAVAAAAISWKTIETAKPKINPNASTKGDILI